MSEESQQQREVDYETVRLRVDNPDTLIIDVREPAELERTGRIPSSINIPLSSVEATLGLATSDEDFRQRFERSKPPEHTELIFYCLSGRRSAQALSQALHLGYNNSKTYVGSWQDWSSRHN